METNNANPTQWVGHEEPDE